MLGHIALIGAGIGARVVPVTGAAGAVGPATTPQQDGGDASGDGLASSVGDVITAVWDNLGNNLYQTGTALAVAAIAIIIMRNMKVPGYIQVPVTIGAFWAGWLGWNTVTGQSNPLFPGDASAIKIWDVAFSGQTGFLVAIIAASIAGIFLWRSNQGLGSRIILLVGAVAGASFVYNLVEAIRIETA